MGLYPYQERVYDLLINQRKNVILQAPTGAGKTRAALYPFFENIEHFGGERGNAANAPLPLTCRYAVPMRVLATQFEREYHNYFGKLDRRGGTNFKRLYTDKLEIKLPAVQTGETPEDSRFESPLTFCTIDQLLASFIGMPYSLGAGQANLNVGGVVGSYLILDEFHLYPLEVDERTGVGGGARMTTLAMLRLLNRFRETATTLSPFILMTATFSQELLDQFAGLLGATVVRVQESELPTIMKGRERVIRQIYEPMSPEAILSAHETARARQAGASLIVCNTVGRAQEMYQRLRALLDEKGLLHTIRLELLHSRFTPEHRAEKSKRLEDWLGEKQWDSKGYYRELDTSDTIVVGTQVIEVGLNISVGVLHTELAPANSIIQRAGRCARFEQQLGEVLVYPIPAGENGQVNYKPYDEKTCQATWDVLASLRAEAAISATAAMPFGFDREQELINRVHTEEDRHFLATFKTGEAQIKRAIMETLASHEYNKAVSLIRNVESVSVLIHATPNETIRVKPFQWESFSLHPGTVKSALEMLEQRQKQLGPFDGPDWVIKQLVGDPLIEQREEENDSEPVYKWDAVSKAEISGALRLVVPPELATYDAELGFRFLRPDDLAAQQRWESKRIDPKKKRDWSRREQRSYVEHIAGLFAAYKWSVRRELAWIGARLETAFSLPAESLDEAVRLAIACHDIGKLNESWQEWAHAIQAELFKRYNSPLYVLQAGREFLAKTDGLEPYRWEEERKLQQSIQAKKPNHACAGVLASAGMVGKWLISRAGEQNTTGASALSRATLSAIARHHTPTAIEYDSVVYSPQALQALSEAFTACQLSTDILTDIDLTSKFAGTIPSGWLVKPDETSAEALNVTWLGFVLVRALRLCDQRAERDWNH